MWLLVCLKLRWFDSLPFDYCVNLQKYILTHILRFFQEHTRGKNEKLELLLDEIVTLSMSMAWM